MDSGGADPQCASDLTVNAESNEGVTSMPLQGFEHVPASVFDSTDYVSTTLIHAELDKAFGDADDQQNIQGSPWVEMETPTPADINANFDRLWNGASEDESQDMFETKPPTEDQEQVDIPNAQATNEAETQTLGVQVPHLSLEKVESVDSSPRETGPTAAGDFSPPAIPRKTPRSSIPKGMLGSLPDAEELARLKQESKRKYTLDEIVRTEETYYRRLRATWEVYIVPLRQLGRVPPEEMDAMFFMWENLMAIHKDFFGALTREGRDAEQVGERVGPMFLKFAPFFNMYLPYMNNFGRATEVRTNLLLENKAFHEFCGAARKQAQCENNSLMDLMLEPIQRIPRYKLLLMQLLKYTEDTSAQHKSITDALGKISEVAKAIDLGIHDAQEAQKNHEVMIEIMMSFTWNTRINLIDDPARRLIKSGPLERQTRKTVKPFYFWLFNDRLVYGEGVPGMEGIYIVHRDLSLDACQARVPPPSVECEPRERAMFIASSQKSFIVWAPSVEEQKEWEHLLKTTIEAYQTSVLGKDAGSGGVAPMWVPNDASTMCLACSAEFSFFTSRHHCRKCGNVVCSACSSFTFLLPNVDKVKESRVCDACFEECVEASGLTLTQYFEMKQQAADATRLGSIRNSISGLFGRRRVVTSGSGSQSPSKAGAAPSAICEDESESARSESDPSTKSSATASTNPSPHPSLRLGTEAEEETD